MNLRRRVINEDIPITLFHIQVVWTLCLLYPLVLVTQYGNRNPLVLVWLAVEVLAPIAALVYHLLGRRTRRALALEDPGECLEALLALREKGRLRLPEHQYHAKMAYLRGKLGEREACLDHMARALALQGRLVMPSRRERMNLLYQQYDYLYHFGQFSLLEPVLAEMAGLISAYSGQLRARVEAEVECKALRLRVIQALAGGDIPGAEAMLAPYVSPRKARDVWYAVLAAQVLLAKGQGEEAKVVLDAVIAQSRDPYVGWYAGQLKECYLSQPPGAGEAGAQSSAANLERRMTGGPGFTVVAVQAAEEVNDSPLQAEVI